MDISFGMNTSFTINSSLRENINGVHNMTYQITYSWK